MVSNLTPDITAIPFHSKRSQRSHRRGSASQAFPKIIENFVYLQLAPLTLVLSDRAMPSEIFPSSLRVCTVLLFTTIAAFTTVASRGFLVLEVLVTPIALSMKLLLNKYY